MRALSTDELGQSSGSRPRLRILHLEDNITDAELIRDLLGSALSCEIHRVETQESFEIAAKHGHYDLVLCDYSLPTFDGLSALSQLRAWLPDLPFIFVSGTIGEDRAVESLKRGATDYVLKGQLVRLVPAIERAIRDAQALEERKQREAIIRQQAVLLDQSPDAVFVTDLEGRVLYWSQGAERMYGWSAAEMQGQQALPLLNRSETASNDQKQKLRQDQSDSIEELRFSTKAGKPVVVIARRTLLREPSGIPSSMLHIHTDITEKKQLEAQFLRNQRLENLGTLASGVAHDLNNILAPVLIGAEVLRERITGPDERRVLETIKASALRGSELIKQILQFVRGDQNTFAPIEIGGLVNEMVELAKDTFPRSITFQKTVPTNLPPVLGDATQIRQMILNLIVNARDAMPKGGTLGVRASEVTLEAKQFREASAPVSGNFVTLEVSDTGTGIAPHLIEKIFQPFFTTKGEGNGNGLGLSTVHNLVLGHKGHIEVASELNRGTTFTIYLPILTAGQSAPPVRPDIGVQAGTGEVVLLVDDESAIREMTKATLESQNYQVLAASDGAEALMLFNQHRKRIKAVITDLMMPILDGPALIQRIRRIDPHARIICISGQASEGKLDAVAHMQIQILLRKPYTSEQLLAALKAVR